MSQLCYIQKIAKNVPPGHHRTTLSGYIFATKACIDNQKKNLLNSNTSSTCPVNVVNFGLLTDEICWWLWGTPGNFNGFHVLAALLHGTLVVGVSQTLRHWTEAPPIFGRAPSLWALAHISIFLFSLFLFSWYGYIADYERKVRWMCTVKSSKELRERLGIDDIILIL